MGSRVHATQQWPDWGKWPVIKFCIEGFIEEGTRLLWLPFATAARMKALALLLGGLLDLLGSLAPLWL
jgi:hypothetical protein